MRGRRTARSNRVYALPGGNEDHDLWVRVGTLDTHLPASDPSAAQPYIASVWEPDQGERAAIATGANLELVIYGRAQPPVSLGVTAEQPLSRPQRQDADTPSIWLELPRELAEAIIELASFPTWDTPAELELIARKRVQLVEAVSAFREQLAGFVAELDRQAAKGSEPDA